MELASLATDTRAQARPVAVCALWAFLLNRGALLAIMTDQAILANILASPDWQSIVRAGWARRLCCRFLRAVCAGFARHRTDRLFAAVVTSWAAIGATGRILIFHVVAVAKPELEIYPSQGGGRPERGTREVAALRVWRSELGLGQPSGARVE